jgi:Right handed beta helix region
VWITADDLQAANPSQLVITTAADTTPPDTTITAGPSGSTASTDATFSFTSSEGGSTFQCSLDGVAFQPCTSPTTYEGLAAADHQFAVRAIDAAGNVDPTPATRTWTVTPPPPPTGFCASSAVAGSWTGTGSTIAATPSTLASAISSAAAGDTVELADGTYDRAAVTLTKPIRLKAAHRYAATFVGGPTPRYANDVGLGTHTRTAIAVRASGVAIDGLDIRYYDTGIDLDGVADVTIQNNRIVSVYSSGVQVWDTRNTQVRCNEMLDPYLAQDTAATVTSPPGVFDAQSDYGVVVYGSLQPRVEHNYFHGVFNEAVSFKEGDWDAYAGYNTFEGSALTALFFGQNLPHNGPYDFTGLPVDNERGSLVGEYNVFREVYGVRNGSNVVYYLRSPIRVWHVNGATTLRGNVIEQAQQGVLLECRAGSQAGCDTGTTRLTGNTIAGQVRDLGGTIRQVNTTAGVLVFTGLKATATIDANAFAMVPTPVGIYSDGVSGTPSYTYTANREFSAPPLGANLDLRAATPATDPDLSYADAYR